jgi:hypothetical protein
VWHSSDKYNRFCENKAFYWKLVGYGHRHTLHLLRSGTDTDTLYTYSGRVRTQTHTTHTVVGYGHRHTLHLLRLGTDTGTHYTY